ncbi:MAG TPA: hypothetical protein VNX65_02310 [Patescibacteria group bacterium]|jgi:hypothetical protein|nr:hypothetical protein [Patescibacteria group bacterium]
MTLQARGDYIFLDQYNEDFGGLQVPAGAVSEMRYKIVSMGSNVTGYSVGDIVVCYADAPVTIEGQAYWIIKEEAILAEVVK